MFSGINKINQKQMQAMMRQLDINQEKISAEKVTIETPDKKIIITNPNVRKIRMQGQESFQITGDIQESKEPQSLEEDIQLIVQKTSCSPEEARKALEETNDLAEAIARLSD